MSRITALRVIDAPIEQVFKTVADIKEFSQALPHVVKFEFLTESQLGVGTRFRETRIMRGKEAITELEVTEYVENDHVRLVADSHGTVWDTVFAVKQNDSVERPAGVELTMTMDANSYKLIPRLMNMLIKGMIQKAVEADMDLVKEYCEQQR